LVDWNVVPGSTKLMRNMLYLVKSRSPYSQHRFRNELVRRIHRTFKVISVLAVQSLKTAADASRGNTLIRQNLIMCLLLQG